MKVLIVSIFTLVIHACQAQPTDPKPNSQVTVRHEQPTTEDSVEQNPISKDEDSPFYFSIETDGGGYNSKTMTLWRLYQEGKKKYHNVVLTESETEAIRAAFDRASFMAFPDKFEPQGNMITSTIPCFRYTMTTEMEGKQKQVVYEDCETDEAMIEAGKPFLDLFTTVWNLLESNEEIKNIPKSNVMWE